MMVHVHTQVVQIQVLIITIQQRVVMMDHVFTHVQQHPTMRTLMQEWVRLQQLTLEQDLILDGLWVLQHLHLEQAHNRVM